MNRRHSSEEVGVSVTSKKIWRSYHYRCRWSGFLCDILYIAWTYELVNSVHELKTHEVSHHSGKTRPFVLPSHYHWSKICRMLSPTLRMIATVQNYFKTILRVEIHRFREEMAIFLDPSNNFTTSLKSNSPLANVMKRHYACDSFRSELRPRIPLPSRHITVFLSTICRRV